MKSRILKSIIAALIVIFLIYKVGINDLIEQFSKLSLEAIIYLALLSVVLIYISAVKWQLFLKTFGEKISIIKLFCLYLIGYFVNLLLPSYIGGDAVRSWYVGKKVGQHEALAATILERYTGIFAMFTLAVISVWFVSLVTVEIKVTVVCMALGLVFATFLAMSESVYGFIDKFRFARKFTGHLRKVRDALNLARKSKVLVLKALILSFLFHSFTVLNTLAAAYAVGWESPPIIELFAILPIILLIGSLPLTPGGLGLQEGAFVYFLKGVGATSTEALALALILRAKSYVLAVFGGILWFNMKPAETVVNRDSSIQESRLL